MRVRYRIKTDPPRLYANLKAARYDAMQICEQYNLRKLTIYFVSDKPAGKIFLEKGVWMWLPRKGMLETVLHDGRARSLGLVKRFKWED